MNSFLSFLLFAILAVTLSSSHIGKVLNKTPKAELGWTSACDECQTIIKRIVEVAKDPTKLAELKILLSALCHETSYEEECRLFVSKIDLFLERLLPYLKDAHRVCQEMHICANSRLDKFHRLGMLYVNKYMERAEGKADLVCEECQFAANELRSLVEEPSIQQDVKDYLQENVCAHMGRYKEMCDSFLDEVLPEIFDELKALLSDPKKFCQELELCPPQLTLGHAGGGHPFMQPRKSISTAKSPFNNVFQKLMFLGKSQGHIDHARPLAGMRCKECVHLMELLKYEMASMNKDAHILMRLVSSVCAHVPSELYRKECLKFMSSYSPFIMFLGAQKVGRQSESFCRSTAGQCSTQQYKLFANNYLKRNGRIGGIRCQSCRAIGELLSVELSKPQFREELMEDLVAYLCEKVPTREFAICDNLVKSYIPLAITKILQELQDDRFCKIVHAC